MKTSKRVEPKQKRSRITKAKLKQAARRLFAEKGYYAVTSNNIATVAAVPIGSFYHYFGDKKGILLELIEDFNTKFHSQILTPEDFAIGASPSSQDLYNFLLKLLKKSTLVPILADPFYRIFHALQFTEPDVLALSEQMRVKELAVLAALLEQIHSHYPINDIPTAAKVMHISMENTVLYLHHLGTSIDQSTLLSETANFFCAYLTQNLKEC